MSLLHIEHNDFVGYAKLKKFLEQPGENKGNYVTTGIKTDYRIPTYLHQNGYKVHPRVTKETTLLIIPNTEGYDSVNFRKALKNPNCTIIKDYDIYSLTWYREQIEKASQLLE
jgi:hypothetical protein